MKQLKCLIFVLLFCGILSAQSNVFNDAAVKYLETLKKPSSVNEFNVPFHFDPLNQDTTNACWSFATLSFVESEMHRLGRDDVKLSMMYAVYYSFVEKARYFVQTKGQSRFAGGDLFSGVLQTIKKYGMIPYDVYQGNARVCKTFNHIGLEAELNKLMKQVKELQIWDEELVVAKVKALLNQHLGAPPEEFDYKGKLYNPRSFAAEIINLPWQDYVIITSFMYAPFNQFISLDVPDNWAGRKEYFNVPLNEFYKSLVTSLQKGYTAAFDSDTGEPGRIGAEDAVFVVPYDLSSEGINQLSREFRFKNGSTTDDHLMHFLSYKRKGGNDWFLVKDSWRTAWDGKENGYYFFHGDYIKLKALAYLVHKDGVPKITEKIKK